MQIYRARFGGSLCEIAAGSLCSNPGRVVAWALLVKSNGRLEPILDGRGRMLRTHASSLDEAIDSMRRLLVTLLGDEARGETSS